LDRYRPLYTLDWRGLRQFVPRSRRTARTFGAACAG